MKNITPLFCGVLAVLSVSACAMYPTTLPPGEYEHTEKSTNARGTETEQSTKTKVYYDAEGNKRAVQEIETERDPEGLFNKETTKTTKTYD